MKSRIVFSSLSDEWNTPKSLFNKLDSEFNFDSDPCPSNVPLKKGLKETGKKMFCNPPYSKIASWIEDCYNYSRIERALVVMLIPSRTDTKWWHNYVMRASEIRFIKGRLKFSDHKNGAPFPSAIIIFRGDET